MLIFGITALVFLVFLVLIGAGYYLVKNANMSVAEIAFHVINCGQQCDQPTEEDINSEVQRRISQQLDTKASQQKLINSFLNGNKNMYTLLQIALFKLSEQGDLFGFKQIVDSIRNEVNLLSTDPNVLTEWAKKLDEYNKTTNGGAN